MRFRKFDPRLIVGFADDGEQYAFVFDDEIGWKPEEGCPSKIADQFFEWKKRTRLAGRCSNFGSLYQIRVSPELKDALIKATPDQVRELLTKNFL